jgi:hypothetical protein
VKSVQGVFGKMVGYGEDVYGMIEAFRYPVFVQSTQNLFVIMSAALNSAFTLL